MANLEPGDILYVQKLSFPDSSKTLTLVDRKNESTLLLSSVEGGVRKKWELTWNGRAWILKDPISVDDDGKEVTVEVSKRAQVILSRLKEEPESTMSGSYLTDLMILTEASVEDFDALTLTNRQMYYVANNKKLATQLYRERFIKYFIQYLGNQKDQDRAMKLLDELIFRTRNECVNLFLDKKEEQEQDVYREAIRIRYNKLSNKDKKKFRDSTCADIGDALDEDSENEITTVNCDWKQIFDSLGKKITSLTVSRIQAIDQTYENLSDEDKAAFEICSWKDIYEAFKIMWDMKFRVPKNRNLDNICHQFYLYLGQNSNTQEVKRAALSKYLIKFVSLLIFITTGHLINQNVIQFEILEMLGEIVENKNNYCLLFLFSKVHVPLNLRLFNGLHLYNLDLYKKVEELHRLQIQSYKEPIQEDEISSVLHAVNMDVYFYIIEKYEVQNLESTLE